MQIDHTPSLSREKDMRLLNQIRHYSGAVIRGIISGRLFTTAGIYLRHRRLENQVLGRIELKVAGGPFAGMHYVRIPAAHALIPKLLGSFEQEIHPFVERAVASNMEIILNVGSAEGYYAVGMALRLPKSQVYAYDIDDRARDLCAGLVAANGVADRVHVRGLCDVAELNARLRPDQKTLIVVDCEGCESDILDPEAAPGLRTATILVEIHDFGSTQHGLTIRQRFAATHDLSVLSAVPADEDRHPELSFISREHRLTLLTERKGPQDWYYLVPRTAPGY
ncbi:MAG: hypothetical protein IPK19_35740 [Chloroflexi bacterium]|nr:hypothetical protein [Chloroflexota bacterium]